VTGVSDVCSSDLSAEGKQIVKDLLENQGDASN
jgi:hypothetical protein